MVSGRYIYKNDSFPVAYYLLTFEISLNLRGLAPGSTSQLLRDMATSSVLRLRFPVFSSNRQRRTKSILASLLFGRHIYGEACCCANLMWTCCTWYLPRDVPFCHSTSVLNNPCPWFVSQLAPFTDGFEKSFSGLPPCPPTQVLQTCHQTCEHSGAWCFHRSKRGWEMIPRTPSSRIFPIIGSDFILFEHLNGDQKILVVTIWRKLQPRRAQHPLGWKCE